MSVANNVHTRRIEKHLSLRRLAEKAGVAFSTIYRLEKGSHRPTYPTLKLISEALEVPVSELIEEGQED